MPTHTLAYQGSSYDESDPSYSHVATWRRLLEHFTLTLHRCVCLCLCVCMYVCVCMCVGVVMCSQLRV
jgi:hypothetical protein